eukprot:TRINITY_DN60425_c0_g1_i1.p1 TRINITY_DN60425_c0_g1~~TRINITY_DN60425_c0_g1_i1.p1  ORF type:complete len:1030 (+),score=367.10 TRINITY_DN60425_c0_g1_i1:141-3092(+)
MAGEGAHVPLDEDRPAPRSPEQAPDRRGGSLTESHSAAVPNPGGVDSPAEEELVMHQPGIQPYAADYEDAEQQDERNKVGVPLEEVLKHMQHRCQASQLGVDFIRYVPFLIMFCFFFFAGRDITANYYVVRVVKDILMGNPLPQSEIVKFYSDIAGAGDYMYWLNDVMVPNIWKDCGRSEPLRNLPPPWNVQLYAQGQNYLLGAMRLRTHRVQNSSCGLNAEVWENASSMQCYAQWSTGDQQTRWGGWGWDTTQDTEVQQPPFPSPIEYPGYDLVTHLGSGTWRVEWPPTDAQLGELHLWYNDRAVDLSNATLSDGTAAGPEDGSGPHAAADLRTRTAWRSAGKVPLVITFDAPQYVDQYTFSTPTCATCSNLRDPVAWRLEGRRGTDDSVHAWTALHSVGTQDESGFTPSGQKGQQQQRFPSGGRRLSASFAWRQLRFTPLRVRGQSIPADSPGHWYKHYKCTDIQKHSLVSYVVGDVDQYHCGGYVVDIPFNESCATAGAVTGALASTNYPFFDNYATRFTMVEFFLYSVQMGTFTSVKLFNEQASCGSWTNKWQIRTFLVWTSRQVGQTVFDFFFLAFVFYFCYRFIMDWLSTYRGHPPGDFRTRGKCFAFLVPSEAGQGFWNLLELANLCIFLTVFGIRLTWFADSQEAAEHIRFPFPPRYPAELDNLLNLYMLQVYLNAVNTVITFLKFLKYVRLNSRLNILTETISLKADNMFACLIIFVFILTAYSLSGYALFGTTVPEYRSVDRSFSTLMRMLLGDFDYVTLRDENRVLAGVFFWSFIVTGLFLMLNFLIAILSEGFAQVSQRQTEVPLEEQIVRAWVGFKRMMRPQRLIQGIRMSLKGQSRAQLLVLATIELEERKQQLDRHREEEGMQAEEDAVGEAALVYRMQLPHYLGENTCELLGADFLDDLWDDLLYEWEITQLNSQKRKEQDDEQMVQDAVAGAIKGQFDEADVMDVKMQGLETELNSLYTMLSAQPG